MQLTIRQPRCTLLVAPTATARDGAGWLKSRESLRSAKDLDPLFMPAGDIEPTDPFDERLLAYLSRVVMARKFIHAAYKFSQPHDSPQQQAVWKRWDAELDEYQDALAAKINWLLSERVTQDNSRRHVVDTWRSDIRNLPGAQEALDSARSRAAQKTAQSRGQGPPPVAGAKR